MSWKERVTLYGRNIFPNIGRQKEKQSAVSENEVKSNLPLQMAAYFNVVFLPVWVVVLMLFLLENYGSFSKLVQLILVTIIITIFIVESMRLYMLYEGNLNDKIPELAGFWMLSVFLQLPLQGLFLFNPHFQLRVLEVVCQSVVFVLLCLQIVFGYCALRYTASEQAKYYKLKRPGIKGDEAENKSSSR